MEKTKLKNKSLLNSIDIKFILVFIFIIAVQFWFVTYGTGNPFGKEGLTTSYDDLGVSLLKGTTTINESSISTERINIDGKIYMYFAPFPAIIRIIPNLLFSSLYGQWSRLSGLFASLICLLAFALLTKQQLSQNKFLTNKQKDIFFYISFISFGLGFPLIYLLSSCYLYHEAIIWGFCWSICGVCTLISLLTNQNQHFLKVFAFSAFTGLAYISKVTFGFPLYLILAPVLISIFSQYIYDRFKINFFRTFQLFEYSDQFKDIKTFALKFFILACPALIAFSIYAWYNYDKYKSIFTYHDHKYDLAFQLNKDHLKNYNDRGGDLCYKRIPTALSYYFGLRADNFSTKAPFVHIYHVPWFINRFYEYNEWIISQLIVSLWIIVGGVLGIFYLTKCKRNKLITISCWALSTHFFIICSFWMISQRYSTEFFPLFIFIYSFYLREIGEEKYLGRLISVKLWILFCVIFSAVSVMSSILSSLHWGAVYNWAAPQEYKNKLIEAFSLIDYYIYNLRFILRH